MIARSSSNGSDLSRSEAMHDRPIFIRRLRRAPIFFSPWQRVKISEALDPNQMGDEKGIKPLLKLEIGPPNLSDLHWNVVMEAETTIVVHDRGSIVARSPCDRG